MGFGRIWNEVVEFDRCASINSAQLLMSSAILTLCTLSLYLTMVLPVCRTLSSFSLVSLPVSRRLIYIMADNPTTLSVDACCALQITTLAALL